MSYSDHYLRVAAALLQSDEERHWVTDLRSNLKMRSGALYPVIWEMLDEGLLEDGWAESPPAAPKGRPRRFYVLTEKGKTELAATARSAKAPARTAARRVRPALA